MNSVAEAGSSGLLPWHGEPWAEWLRQLRSSRLPHAALISGLAGLGKRQLAERFAQGLLCAEVSDQGPCGHCKACQLLHAGSHPDFREIGPEEPGKAIKIAQVRALVGFLSGTAQQGGWKCVIIEPADAMNNHAANALLKSLEEPPGDTLIILVTAMPSQLAATLRSRCQQIQLRAPSREDALQWLKPHVGSEADALLGTLLDYAHGAPLAALRASRADHLQDRSEILAALLKLAQAQASAVDTAKNMQSRPGLEAIDQVLALLHNMARLQLGIPREGQSDEWQDILKRVDKHLLFRFRDKLIQAKRLLLSGANPNHQLLWEELMFDWQALTATGAVPRPARQLI